VVSTSLTGRKAKLGLEVHAADSGLFTDDGRGWCCIARCARDVGSGNSSGICVIEFLKQLHQTDFAEISELVALLSLGFHNLNPSDRTSDGRCVNVGASPITSDTGRYTFRSIYANVPVEREFPPVY